MDEPIREMRRATGSTVPTARENHCAWQNGSTGVGAGSALFVRSSNGAGINTRTDE